MSTLRDFERELVGEKHWTLRGEVSSRDRPENSLLEEGGIEFKLSNRAHDASVVVDEDTGETTDRNIEDTLATIIKKRVGLKLWDDVALRTAVNADGEEEAAGKKELTEVLEEAETTKVKKSLIEEYTSSMHVTKTGAAIDVAETEREVGDLWKRLSAKLDQYCLA